MSGVCVASIAINAKLKHMKVNLSLSFTCPISKRWFLHLKLCFIIILCFDSFSLQNEKRAKLAVHNLRKELLLSRVQLHPRIARTLYETFLKLQNHTASNNSKLIWYLLLSCCVFLLDLVLMYVPFIQILSMIFGIGYWNEMHYFGKNTPKNKPSKLWWLTNDLRKNFNRLLKLSNAENEKKLKKLSKNKSALSSIILFFIFVCQFVCFFHEICCQRSFFFSFKHMNFGILCVCRKAMDNWKALKDRWHSCCTCSCNCAKSQEEEEENHSTQTKQRMSDSQPPSFLLSHNIDHAAESNQVVPFNTHLNQGNTMMSLDPCVHCPIHTIFLFFYFGCQCNRSYYVCCWHSCILLTYIINLHLDSNQLSSNDKDDVAIETSTQEELIITSVKDSKKEEQVPSVIEEKKHKNAHEYWDLLRRQVKQACRARWILLPPER